MGLIYVPVDDISDYSCYVVYDSQTIRAYYSSPVIGDNNYTDFYVNSHYLSSEGVQNISSTVPKIKSTTFSSNKGAFKASTAFGFF